MVAAIITRIAAKTIETKKASQSMPSVPPSQP
jgi:hypothetical protein